jgi:hypothetical protein
MAGESDDQMAPLQQQTAAPSSSMMDWVKANKWVILVVVVLVLAAGWWYWNRSDSGIQLPDLEQAGARMNVTRMRGGNNLY